MKLTHTSLQNQHLKERRQDIYRVQRKNLNNTYQKNTLMRINRKIVVIVVGLRRYKNQLYRWTLENLHGKR